MDLKYEESLKPSAFRRIMTVILCSPATCVETTQVISDHPIFPKNAPVLKGTTF